MRERNSSETRDPARHFPGYCLAPGTVNWRPLPRAPGVLTGCLLFSSLPVNDDSQCRTVRMKIGALSAARAWSGTQEVVVAVKTDCRFKSVVSSVVVCSTRPKSQYDYKTPPPPPPKNKTKQKHRHGNTHLSQQVNENVVIVRDLTGQTGRFQLMLLFA